MPTLNQMMIKTLSFLLVLVCGFVHSAEKTETCINASFQGWYAEGKFSKLEGGFELVGSLHGAMPQISLLNKNTAEKEKLCLESVYNKIFVEASPLHHVAPDPLKPSCISQDGIPIWIYANTHFLTKTKESILKFGATSLEHALYQHLNSSLLSLEHVNHQMNAMNSLSCDTQNDMLRVAKHTSLELQYKDRFESLINAYQDQFFSKLKKSSDELYLDIETHHKKEIQKKLLYDRDQYFANQIFDMSKKAKKGDKYLIVVGLAHLLGDQSLLVMLRKMGIEVSELKYKAY